MPARLRFVPVVPSGELPVWLPAKGSWSGTIASGTAISLNTAYSQRGNFPSRFLDTRVFDHLWVDYSGAAWNTYMGVYGAMIFGAAGGHAGAGNYQPQVDNGSYAWNADTREWFRLADLTYPGEVPDSDFVPTKNPPWTSDLLNDYGELATGVPSSSHTRALPCIIPPTWSGSQGGYCIPHLMAYHTGDGNVGAGYVHILDCDLALSVGSAAASAAGGGWSRVGPENPVSGRAWAGCVDSTRGYVYVANNGSSYDLSRLNLNTLAWADVTPSGWLGSGFYGKTIQYIPEFDLLIQMKEDFSLLLMPAGGAPLSYTLRTPTGATPTLVEDAGDNSGIGFVWCPDLPPYGAIVHWNSLDNTVSACYAPASPLSGTWNWVELAATNLPTQIVTYSQPNHLWYNRFQYAPTLKSFFVCTMPNDAYGGIVCFCPSEIP